MHPPLHGVPGGGLSFPLPELSPVSKYVPVHLRGSIISKVASLMLWFMKMELIVRGHLYLIHYLPQSFQ